MKETVADLYDTVQKHGFILEEDYKQANIIVSVGDDDTFLQAVRNTGFRGDCLYAGISINDSNGVYCDFQLDQLDKMMEAMTKEDIEVRRYPTIDVTIDGGEVNFKCLNEFSIRSSIIKTFVMEVFIDDLHFETFRGDGLIVSTPTGSTGITRSVNGSMVDPLLPCIQVSELASINNNRYRTLGSSFILSGERNLTLHVVQDGNDFPIMGMDNEALSIQHVVDVQVTLGDHKIKTIKLKNNSFWDKVKRNFL